MSSLILPAESDYALALREPNLLVPGRKPVGAVEIDWSHPAANGLRYFALVNGPGGLTRDATGYYGSASTIGTVAAGVDAGGEHADFTSAGGLRIWGGTGNTRSMLGTPSGMSVLLVGSASNTSTRTTLLGDWNSEGQGNSLIVEFKGHLQPNATINIMFGLPVDDGGYVTAKTGALNNVVYAIGATTDGTTQRTWVDGIAGNTRPKGSWAIPSGTQFPALGQGGAFTPLRANGNVYLVALWDTDVPGEVMRALTENPYQLLRSANNTPFALTLPTGTPSTVTLSNLTFAARTATSITPRLDVTVS